MESEELLEQLKAEKFDLAITEPFDSCGYGTLFNHSLFHKWFSGIIEYLQIPAHVAVLSCSRMDHVSHVLGQPIAPSFVPGTQSVYGDRMTMTERFMNLLQFFSGHFMFADIGDYEFENAKRILGIKRSWRVSSRSRNTSETGWFQETLPEASFLLTNHIPILDFPAPTFDKIIPIGGISVQTNRTNLKLSHRFDTMLSMRKKNVLISFGSNIRSMDMPDEFKYKKLLKRQNPNFLTSRKSLVALFQAMPDTTFIWKYENIADRKYVCDVLNINRAEWIPQNEMLADPRLNAFITHGGLGSVTELAMMGKPAVVVGGNNNDSSHLCFLQVPIFADQTRNAEMLKRHGGVEVLHKTDLGNPKTIETALRKVMEDERWANPADCSRLLITVTATAKMQNV